MDNLVKLAVSRMSGWDFLVALGIVLVDEFPIKTWIFKKQEKFSAIYKYAPIVLGILFYLIYALATKDVWYMGVIHGGVVGFASMGCYDAILKRGTKEGLEDMKDLNKAIEEEMKK